MEEFDTLMIGGGMMSATFASMVAQADPSLKLGLIEQRPEGGTESSNTFNNAGTGHAGYCELNYTPLNAQGVIEAEKAKVINDQWRASLLYWAELRKNAGLNSDFIRQIPHMSFAEGEKEVTFLRKRYEALSKIEAFKTLEYSEDRKVIAEWAPLLMEGRGEGLVAATFMAIGTDIDFGKLTRCLLEENKSLKQFYSSQVEKIAKTPTGWAVTMRSPEGKQTVLAKFIFVGAGGGTLALLQKAHMPEIKGYAGFPIAGKFWVSRSPEINTRHDVKIYSPAPEGAPGMAGPHIDTRVIDGQRLALFGPFAGVSPRFLKNGSLSDFFKVFRWHNLGSLVTVAWRERLLALYLVRELFSSKKRKLAAVRRLYPHAELVQWEETNAGQRVQIIKPGPSRRGGKLQFGTELVVSKDKTLVGLLGASPGASTAVSIALAAFSQTNPVLAEHYKFLSETPTEPDSKIVKYLTSSQELKRVEPFSS